jgi:hypothetical protein
MQMSTRPLGKVRGTGEVRDKDGNLKGYISFEGTTDLTEDGLRRRLQLDPELALTQKSEDK